MTALATLAAAAIAPPDDAAIPAALEPAIRIACAGAWRAVEVVLAGDVLRGRLSKTRDSIVRDAVEGVLGLHGNVGIRADALASLREAREAGALDGPLEVAALIEAVRQHGAVAVGRGAIAEVRRELASYGELEQVLGDNELASLLIDAARAIFRTLARDPELTRWAIGPTGSPGRDRALAAFAELAASPESIAELEALIALPIHLDDNVQFTVYRPRAIDPGKWHQLLAFAHLAERRPGEDDLPDPVEEVQRQAKSVLGDKAKNYQPVIQDAGAAIPEEGELTFVPEFPGIEVNPPRRSFLWLETVHREEFRIRAPRELDGKTVRGRVTVFLGHIAIAEVGVSVRVDAARPEPTKREPAIARAYRKIFASYSHRDIEIVNQFETYARALGDEYLRDWVHLRTGEVWTDRLCQLIEQADAFQLFWSRNSMHSKFVRQEYEHALSLDRPSFVRPTYWEDPMPVAPGLPPESLLRLHFQKLGAAMLGDAGRTDAAIDKAKRAKRDELVVDRERAPTSLSDTDQWPVEAPLDSVTDPQFELPEAARSATDIHAFPPHAFTPDAFASVDEARHSASVDDTQPSAAASMRRRSANKALAEEDTAPSEVESMRRSAAKIAEEDTAPAEVEPGVRHSNAAVSRPPVGGRMPSLDEPAPSASRPMVPRPAPGAMPAPSRPSPRPAPGVPSKPITPSAPVMPSSRPSPGPMPSAASGHPPSPASAPGMPSSRPSPAPGRPSPAPSAAPSMPSSSPAPGPMPANAPGMPSSRPSPAPAASRPAAAPMPMAASARPSQRPYEPTTLEDELEDAPIEPPRPSIAAVGERRASLAAMAKNESVELADLRAAEQPRLATQPGPGPITRTQVVQDADIESEREVRVQTNPGIGPSKIPHTQPHAAPPPPRPSAIACTMCGHNNAPDVSFCLNCGTDLVPVPRPASMKTMLAPPAAALAETPVQGADLRPAPSAIAPMPPGLPPAGAAPIVSAMAPPPSMVSPYAATVPQEAYKPDPDEILSAKVAIDPDKQKKGAASMRPSMPNAPASSRWPLILIVIGILLVAGVIVFWLLRS